MISIPEEEREDLAAQFVQAVESLDVGRVRALLAGGVPADAWGILVEQDLPLQRVARLDGPEALEIARALIDAGADIDYQGDFYCTALARAVEATTMDRNDWAMARYLIAAGANPSIPDHQGLCPAEYASSEGHSNAVLAMLQAGMDPNVSGLAGPLIWYCAWDDPVVVQALLECGGAPDGASNAIGGSAQTPLQRAAEAFANGGKKGVFVKIAVALINAGADSSRLKRVPDCLQAYFLAQQEEAVLGQQIPGAPELRSRPGRRGVL